MNKYIIKGCPCYWHIGEDDGCSLENLKNCEDDNNCMPKKLLKLCEDACNKALLCNALDIASVQVKDIFELLKIEVINNDK